jgi:hypothetical protein
MRKYATKFHRNAEVTLWNVYSQQWERHSAAALVSACDRPAGDLLLPTLSEPERNRIKRMAMNT